MQYLKEILDEIADKNGVAFLRSLLESNNESALFHYWLNDKNIENYVVKKKLQTILKKSYYQLSF